MKICMPLHVHSKLNVLTGTDIIAKVPFTQMGKRDFCLVPVTLISGLNTEKTAYDSKFDSKFRLCLCNSKIVLLHIAVCNSKIFIAVFLEHITVCIERYSYIRMSENILKYLCRHSAFNTPCCICMSE